MRWTFFLGEKVRHNVFRLKAFQGVQLMFKKKKV